MKSTFTILFYLRKNRTNEKELAPIMNCITINGEKAQFSTKLQTHLTLWEQKTGRCIEFIIYIFGRMSRVIIRIVTGILRIGVGERTAF